MADEDPDLFATYLEEIEARDQRRARFEEWNNTHELLAAVGELVSILRIEHLMVNTKKGTKAPDVWRARRPGQPPEKTGVSPREMALQMMRG